MSLDKVVKEKDELRSLNSHALKEIFISCSDGAETAENQTKNLILQLAALQWKMKSQLHRMFTTKVGFSQRLYML